MIRGHHHLTFCVGGAQEDYDFHVRLLGLRSVKKTVLFDGEIPIYHLYYANGSATRRRSSRASPTARPAGWAGAGPTSSAPSTSRSRRVARLLGRPAARGRHRGHRGRAPRHAAPRLRPPLRDPVLVRRRDRGRRPRALGRQRRAARARDPRCVRHHHLRARARADGRVPAPRDGRRPRAVRRAPPPVPDRHRRGRRAPARLVEEPELPQGSWTFGEGTIHHHAFDAVNAENQAATKDWIVGLGYTDVSDVKDRGYFHSVYFRTPGGALFELAAGTPQGFTIDEPEEEFGTHMCIPPHWEDRRSEISQLEPIDTLEKVVG